MALKRWARYLGLTYGTVYVYIDTYTNTCIIPCISCRLFLTLHFYTFTLPFVNFICPSCFESFDNPGGREGGGKRWFHCSLNVPTSPLLSSRKYHPRETNYHMAYEYRESISRRPSLLAKLIEAEYYSPYNTLLCEPFPRIFQLR